MTSDIDDKKELVKRHIQGLKETKKTLGKDKETVRKTIKGYKSIYDSLDQAESLVGKIEAVVVNLDDTGISQISSSGWNRYQDIVYDTETACSSGEAFHQDLSDHSKRQRDLAASANGIHASWATTNVNSYYSFKAEPVLEPFVEALEAQATLNDRSEFVKAELKILDSSIADTFDKVLRDWKTADPEVKYTRLLDLRSIIFDQLFEMFCPESQYSRTPWHKLASSLKQKPKLRKRFCQPKFFMIGNTDETSLIRTAVTQVDSLAFRMQKHFNDLAEYGKYGKDEATTDSTFSGVLSTFYECLQVRSNYYV